MAVTKRITILEYTLELRFIKITTLSFIHFIHNLFSISILISVQEANTQTVSHKKCKCEKLNPDNQP